jgi:hypothetical protein
VVDLLANGKVQEQPKYSLVLCDAQLLKDSWKFIRKGLLRIKDKDKRSGQWIPEHVRQRIEAGLAGRIFCEAYLCVDSDSNPVGFCVVTCGPDEFVGVPLSLFMWITYCQKPMRDVLPQVMPTLIKRRDELGLRYIDGVSSRWGWMKELARNGFRVHQYIFRHEDRA